MTAQDWVELNLLTPQGFFSCFKSSGFSILTQFASICISLDLLTQFWKSRLGIMLPKRAENMASFRWSLLNYAVKFFKMTGDQETCPFCFIRKVLKESGWNWVKFKKLLYPNYTKMLSRFLLKLTLSKFYPDICILILSG